MKKNPESIVDCCIRILRKADASAESKDLAEAVLRAELNKPSQIVQVDRYLPAYPVRPVYPWNQPIYAQAMGQARQMSATADKDLSALTALMGKN